MKPELLSGLGAGAGDETVQCGTCEKAEWCPPGPPSSSWGHSLP